MSISENEIRDDFKRFLRHEAMRANTTQHNVALIIAGFNSDSKQL